MPGPNLSGTLSGQTTTDQTPINPFSNVLITDDVGQTETVTVALDPATGALGNLGNGSYNAGTGSYTDTGTAAAVSADLNGLVFTPVAGVPGHSATTTFAISDTDTAAAHVSDNTTSVIVTSALPTPTIIGTAAGQTTTNRTPVNPFSNVLISDNIGQTETVTVTLDPTTGALSHLGNGNYASGTGIYTDVGAPADVSADLNGLVFTPAAGVPGHSVTTGFAISDTDTAAVTVSDNTTTVIATAANPTLTISGTVAGQAISDQTSINPFSNVLITDASGQTETVTVTLDPTTGALSHTGNGRYDAGTGTYTDTGTAAAVSTDLHGLVFTPVTGVAGQSVTTTFAISDTDTAAVTVNDTATTVITTAASPAPTIIGAVAGQTTTNETPVSPFSNVLITDTIGQTETVTVTLDPTTGSLGHPGNGNYDPGTGIYTDVGTATAVSADLNGLMFTPVAGVPGQSVTTTFAISDTDSGAATVSDNTTSVIATSPLPTPTIIGAHAGQTTTGQGAIHPFAGVVITDDISQTDTVTVSLSNPANGILSNLGSGLYNAETGVYTDAGTAAEVTANLTALLFTPAAGVPGHSVTTTLAISDTDTAAVTVSDTTTSVIAAAPLPTPAITGALAGQTTIGQGVIHLFAGVVLTDNIGQTDTVRVSMSNPVNGTLSNLGSGVYNAETGIYTDAGTAAQVTADLHALLFTPAQGVPGHSVTTSFAISDTDTAAVTATNGTTSVIATRPSHAGYDFDGNGISDVLYQNPVTLGFGYSAMSSGNGPAHWVGYGPSSAAYAVAGIGDFDGNGTSDILFRNNTTGASGYLSDAVNGGQGAWVNLGISSTAYSIVGNGDFNGDGTTDLLFRDTASGGMGIYLLSTSGPNTWQSLGSPSLLYSVVGVGDFTGSGRSDILFENTATGNMGYYKAGSGDTQAAWVSLGNTSTAYSVVGVGDFNGNGTSDILFQNNATGDTGYVSMAQNNGPATWVGLGRSSTAYSVVATGDFTGSGAADILFRNNATGDVGYLVPARGGNAAAYHYVGTSSSAYSVIASPTFG